MFAVCMVMIAAATSAAASDNGPPFPRIANCYGVRLVPDSTPQDIEEIARFDLLIGGVWANWNNEQQRRKLAERIAAIRGKNPHIIILDFSSSAPYARPKDPTFPASGWLLQPNGTHVTGWPGTEMINLLKPEVIAWLVQRSAASVRDKGFDGTYIDCMGGGFDWWACNIESREPYQIDANEDGQPDARDWLNRQWIEAKTELSRKVRETIGPQAVFMTNQAGEWGFPYMNGILLEDYLDHVLTGVMNWDHVLETYLHWTQTPHKPNVTTIVSSSGLEPPFNPWKTMAQQARDELLERGRNRLQRMRFGLATTLMGDGYYAYDLHTRWRGQRWWYPEYDAPLGYPKRPASRQDDGTWRREFDGGTVIVNPTLFDAQVQFEDRRQDVSSSKVDRRFVIPAQDGRLFLPTAAAFTAGTIPDPRPLFTLAGTEPVIERDGRVLSRMQGAAAIFDIQGRLLVLSDGRTTLLEHLRPFIVSNTQWQDFAYSDCRYQVLPDGRLQFTGKRTEKGVTLSYRQEVRVSDRTLMISYTWEALTDAHIHMWRHQVDFPVTAYGGGRFRIKGTVGDLPKARAPQAHLVGDFDEITLEGQRGPGVVVRISGPSTLVDERHYGVQAFRLGHYLDLARGNIAAGRKWQVVFRIRIE